MKARDKDIKKRKHLTPGRRYKTYIESITGGDIKAMEGPMIAATDGYAFGRGIELAFACHIRIAATNAKFGQSEVNYGLMAFGGGTQRLPRSVGRGRALLSESSILISRKGKEVEGAY